MGHRLQFDGGYLKDIRLKAGLSQRELAERIGVKQSSVCRYEVGLFQPPGHVVAALSKHFKVEAGKFYKGRNSGGPKRKPAKA